MTTIFSSSTRRPTSTHQVVDGKPKDTTRIMALSLKDLAKQPELVYALDEELDVITLGKPEVYGNYFCFQIVAYKPSEVEITDDNYLEYVILKTFTYDIKNKHALLSDILLYVLYILLDNSSFYFITSLCIFQLN